MTIKEFVQNVLADKTNRNSKMDLGKLTEEEIKTLQEQIGLDLTDFRRILDNSGVKHAFKKHGNAKTEALRGQIEITAEDFEKIPEIVQNPDLIEHKGLNRLGNDLILYEKEFDAVFCYVEGLRESKKKNRKEAYLETLYKKKASKK